MQQQDPTKCELHGEAYTYGCPGCDAAIAEQDMTAGYESLPPEDDES